MRLRKKKTDEEGEEIDVAPKILVLDDNPDSGHLFGKLLRREGFEVAEIQDVQVAQTALNAPRAGIDLLVINLANAGNAASLKLIERLRHAINPEVSDQRILVMLHPTRQADSVWKSGVDEVLVRPFPASEFISNAIAAVDRAEDARTAYRQTKMESIQQMDFLESSETTDASSHS